MAPTLRGRSARPPDEDKAAAVRGTVVPRLLQLQATAGNDAVTRLLVQRAPLATSLGVQVSIAADKGAVAVFDRPVTPEEAAIHLWSGPVSDPSVLVADPPASTRDGRHLRFRLRLGGNPDLVEKLPAALKLSYLAAERAHAATLKRAGEQRAPVGGLLARLDAVGKAASAETDGATFQAAVHDFRTELDKRVKAAPADALLPPDVAIVMQALILWSKDSGDQWGEGSWDSKDLVMSAADYAVVPASQYKCNAYVAEVLFGSLGLVHKAIASAEQPGKFFPYQARQWGNAGQLIPNFPVVTAPQLGDIWSNGSHTGIFLGAYQGKNLYISARDDGSGVFALDKGQHAHGIQIKYMTGGTFRRYTP